MKTKYRVVTDDAFGYEVQFKKFLFWRQASDISYGINTHYTLKGALDLIEKLKKEESSKSGSVVWSDKK